MNIIKKYIAYLKDNPEGYWFKRKLYGWGWTPARWQGWMVLLVWFAIVIYEAKKFDDMSHSASDTLIGFAPRLIFLALILLAICYWKGESPRWQWGEK